ncbi:LuxR C-terminal-related transcriptional regulator [Saccharothrix saharensis]|uniref:helix-turn-helix transcriptional regulator n=1 Tax=Saccharothrix saharensis TaxID=571190 RepID=UPI0036AF3A08
MERVTCTILDSLPGAPAHPRSPDLLRLLGGPRGEHSPRPCRRASPDHHGTAALLSLGGDRAEVVRRADAHLTDTDRCPDPVATWQSLLALVFAGDLVLADLHCARLSARPRWSGATPAAQVVHVVRSRIGFLVGDPDGARHTLCELARAPITGALDAVVVGWLTEALIEVGQPAAAEELLIGRGYSGTLPAGLPGKALLLHARASLHLALGRPNSALKDFAACGTETADCDFANPAVLPWRTGVALCLRELGQPDVARRLVRTDLAAAQRWGAPGQIGRALLAAARLEHGPSARSLFTEAVDLLSVANAFGDLGHAARVFHTVPGLADDVAWARRTLRRIADLTARGGNRHAADRAAAALARFLSAHGDPNLTKHEISVAKLVWAGYDNTEIADRLSLTRRTVEHHLSSIYRKLRLPNRRHLFLAMSDFF